jgi:RNA polymerase sigma-70 factor, ECF subfamily
MDSTPANNGETEELESMRLLAAGDDSVLNRLMEDWGPCVTAMLYRMTGNPAVAGDLAQETFVRLYQTCRRFRAVNAARPFSTWLFGIAANLAKNHLRWKGRHPEVSLESASDPATGDNPASSAESAEKAAAVRKAVTALPLDQREALVLSEYEGLSHAEIAAVAGCSVKAVERRLSHARETLRKELTRYLNG